MQLLHERRTGAEQRYRPEVLLVLPDEDDAAATRAAVHLAGLSARSARSFGAVVERDPPLLVVYDAVVPSRSARERELLEQVRAVEVPLVCVSDAPQPLIPDVTLRRPFTPLDVLGAASRAQPQLYDHRFDDGVEPDLEDKLLLVTHDLRRATDDADRSLAQAAVALVDLLRLRDIETAMHCYRVHAYARMLAQAVAPEILEDHTTALGFLLHDIGKLALPDRILQKPGPLSDPERQIVQTHPVVGAEMARRFLTAGRGLNVIRFHHERWDGAGYPDRLAQSAIPIEARIFAAADALDALTSDRPYRAARRWPSAIDVLEQDAGTHFDPTVIAALHENAAVLHRLHERATSGRERVSDTSGVRHRSDCAHRPGV
ncbi:MAG TPA: HD domain-containing phosphohydrolase [Gaiellaceae bacterium]|nr:HD domain-containing phosphohydrolase [Gaiellaceae bacterium]